MSVTQNTATQDTTNSKLLSAALDYAARGWAVFPCHSVTPSGGCTCGKTDCSNPGKHPLGKLTPNGLKDATTDAQTIREWWEQAPHANIAIRTGGELIVLDIDGEEAFESIRERSKHLGELPETRSAKTGKGHHSYYSKPADRVAKNTTGEQGKRGLGPKLDSRGDGGYVMAPPSNHHSGKAYEWLNPETPIAPLPSGWLDFLSPKAQPRKQGEIVALPSRSDTASAYGRKALEEELQTLSRTKEGERNQQLNASSYALGQLVAGGELDHTTTEAELCRVGLELGLGETEVTGTVARALRDAQKEPRSAPVKPSEALATVTGLEPPKALSKALRPYTDLGNAERLLDLYEHRLRYCGELGGWQTFDGKRWRRDNLSEAVRLAGESARAIRKEPVAGASKEERETNRKRKDGWAVRSESTGRIKAALEQALALEGFATRADDYDTHPLLLCVDNGLLNLESFELQPHDRSKLITRLSPVEYQAKATAPIWEAFLERVLPDPELRAFAQRIAGLCLTGDRSAQAFFLLIGKGANGKSVFTETLLSLTGEYGAALASSSLLVKRDSAIPNDIARLRGARLVTAAESGEGKRLDETLVKQLTGGDRMSARFMRGEWFEFEFEGCLLLSTNHAPRITGTDAGIWRRVMVLPFEVTIPPEEQDKRLPVKLLEELPGILLWAIEGYRDYVAGGRQLNPPKAVEKANAAYRESEDPLGDFLSECVVSPNSTVGLGELYTAYTEWASASGERADRKTDFGKALVSRGFTKDKSGSRGWFWRGIALAENLLDSSQGQ